MHAGRNPRTLAIGAWVLADKEVTNFTLVGKRLIANPEITAAPPAASWTTSADSETKKAE